MRFLLSFIYIALEILEIFNVIFCHTVGLRVYSVITSIIFSYMPHPVWPAKDTQTHHSTSPHNFSPRIALLRHSKTPDLDSPTTLISPPRSPYKIQTSWSLSMLNLSSPMFLSPNPTESSKNALMLTTHSPT